MANLLSVALESPRGGSLESKSQLLLPMKLSGLPLVLLLGWSLGQRNGGVPTWVDLAGTDPRDQTQGI